MSAKDKTIFNSLYNILHDNINQRIYPTEIVTFLLGENFQSSGERSINTTSKLRSGNRTLSVEHLYQISISTNWSFRRLEKVTQLNIEIEDKRNVRQKLAELYREYFPDKQIPDSESDMFHALINLHFFGYPDSSSCFVQKDIRHCRHYINWEEKYHDISRLLATNNILFITGAPASGKKELVKQYILENRTVFKDIGWLDCEYEYTSLKNRLTDLCFLGNRQIQDANEVIQLLSSKSSHSILVIDIPTPTSDDFEYIKTFFQELNLKIIFTTRSMDIPNEFAVLNIDGFPIENMFELYKSWISFPKPKDKKDEKDKKPPIPNISDFVSKRKDLFSVSEFQQLCNIIDNNPLIITLIARLVLKSTNLDDFKRDLLDPNIWIWKNQKITTNSLYKINNEKYSSPKSENKLPRLLFRMLNNYPEEYMSEVGVMLSVFAKEAIDTATLSYFVSEENIQYALNYGLLSYIDSNHNYLKMPGILVHTIWEKYPIERINSYWSEVNTVFILLLNNNFPIQSIYSITASMIYRYHFNIFVTTHFSKKGYEEKYQLWNSFLISAIQCFLTMGNFEIVEKFIPFLFKCKTINCPNEKYRELTSETNLQNILRFHYQLCSSNNVFDTIKHTNVEKHIKSHPIFPDSKDLWYKKEIIDSFSSVIQTMGDYFVRLEHSITINHIVNKEPLEIDKIISLILDELAICSDALSKQKYISLYYQLILNYIKLLYKKDYCISNINEISDIFFQAYYKSGEISHQLFWKFELQSYYYSLLHTLYIHFYENIPYPEKFFSQAFTYFQKYYDICRNNILSWDTMWSFYAVTFLLKSLLPPNESAFHLLINDALQSFEAFITEQLNFPDAETRKELLQNYQLLFTSDNILL